MVLGPIVVSFVNQRLDAQFQSSPISFLTEQSAEPQAACIPDIDADIYTALEQLVVTSKDDFVVSLKMANLIFADQAVRRFPGSVDPLKVSEEDTSRRVEVLVYIQNGEIHAGRDLIYAAFIFQHGDCSAHYQFANRLAQIAMDAGFSDARWIYAATLDRYLMSLGEPQKYGTQYTWIEGEFKLYPVDPATTDDERAQYNVPPLQEALEKQAGQQGGGSVRKRWLESWWLTLIGAGFAALAAIMGLVDGKPNALRGWVVLGLAFFIYPLSIIGHYAQIIALNQGVIETQKQFWLVVNTLTLVVWFAFAVFEGIRVSRNKNP